MSQENLPQFPAGAPQAQGPQNGNFPGGNYPGQGTYQQGNYQQPAGYQQYGAPMYLAEHPQATTVLVLGIVGIFVGLLSFVAWYMGGKARKEIQAGAPYLWDGSLKTGYYLGKVFGIIYIMGIALWILIVILAVVSGGMAQEGY